MADGKSHLRCGWRDLVDPLQVTEPGKGVLRVVAEDKG
jgi:hypothetical protein